MSKKNDSVENATFTGKPPQSIDFTGYLYGSRMPYGSAVLMGSVDQGKLGQVATLDQPVFFSMASEAGVLSDQLILPIFKTEEALRAFFGRLDIAFASIKQITNGVEFILDVRDRCKVVADPYFTPEGRVRFLHITLPGDQ